MASDEVSRHCLKCSCNYSRYRATTQRRFPCNCEAAAKTCKSRTKSTSISTPLHKDAILLNSVQYRQNRPMLGCSASRGLKTPQLLLLLLLTAAATALQADSTSSTIPLTILTQYKIPDTTAIVGRLFLFPIPPDAYPGNVSRIDVFQQGQTDLPSWLSFTSSSQTFFGVPLEVDAGTVYITVNVYYDEDYWATSQEIFSIDVLSSFLAPPLQLTSEIAKIKVFDREWVSNCNRSMPNFPLQCPPGDSRVLANVHFVYDVSSLSPAERVQLLLALGQKLAICPLQLTLHSHQDLTGFTIAEDSISSDYPLNTAMMSLLIHCDSASANIYPAIIQDTIKDLESVLNMHILQDDFLVQAWSITTNVHVNAERSARRRRNVPPQLEESSNFPALSSDEFMTESIALFTSSIVPFPSRTTSSYFPFVTSMALTEDLDSSSVTLKISPSISEFSSLASSEGVVSTPSPSLGVMSSIDMPASMLDSFIQASTSLPQIASSLFPSNATSETLTRSPISDTLQSLQLTQGTFFLTSSGVIESSTLSIFIPDLFTSSEVIPSPSPTFLSTSIEHSGTVLLSPSPTLPTDIIDFTSHTELASSALLVPVETSRGIIAIESPSPSALEPDFSSSLIPPGVSTSSELLFVSISSSLKVDFSSSILISTSDASAFESPSPSVLEPDLSSTNEMLSSTLSLELALPSSVSISSSIAEVLTSSEFIIESPSPSVLEPDPSLLSTSVLETDFSSTSSKFVFESPSPSTLEPDLSSFGLPLPSSVDASSSITEAVISSKFVFESPSASALEPDLPSSKEISSSMTKSSQFVIESLFPSALEPDLSSSLAPKDISSTVLFESPLSSSAVETGLSSSITEVVTSSKFVLESPSPSALVPDLLSSDLSELITSSESVLKFSSSSIPGTDFSSSLIQELTSTKLVFESPSPSIRISSEDLSIPTSSKFVIESPTPSVLEPEFSSSLIPAELLTSSDELLLISSSPLQDFSSSFAHVPVFTSIDSVLRSSSITDRNFSLSSPTAIFLPVTTDIEVFPTSVFVDLFSSSIEEDITVSFTESTDKLMMSTSEYIFRSLISSSMTDISSLIDSSPLPSSVAVFSSEYSSEFFDEMSFTDISIEPTPTSSLFFTEQSSLSLPSSSSLTFSGSSLLAFESSVLPEDLVSTLFTEDFTSSSEVLFATTSLTSSLFSESDSILLPSLFPRSTVMLPSPSSSPVDSGPILIHPIDDIIVHEGKPFDYHVGGDTFYDYEDGSNLTLVLDNVNTPWVQLKKEVVIYILALSSQIVDNSITNYEIELRAYDRSDNFASNLINIAVIPEYSQQENYIQISIDEDFASFDVSARVDLTLKLGSPDPDSIYIRDLSSGSVIVTYTNLSILTHDCNGFMDWTETIYRNGSYLDSFRAQISPYVPTGTAIILGPCASSTTQVFTETLVPTIGVIQPPVSTRIILLAVIIPVVVLACLMLIIGAAIFVNYHRKRSERRLIPDALFLNRDPVIFTDQLDIPTSRSRKPTILRGYHSLLQPLYALEEDEQDNDDDTSIDLVDEALNHPLMATIDSAQSSPPPYRFPSL